MIHVIIGVGAAGITAAKTIRENDPDAAITMISTDEHVHSRCMLHRYLSHERNEDTLSFVEPDFFETYRIQWRNGVSVRTIDTAEQVVVLNDNTCCSYDRLLIATGANSFIPPVGQFREANNVFGLRHLSDAQAIRSLADQANRILVVGSGLVGMDAAYAFLERGKDVTVVEMADRILPIQLNETAGNAYRTLFESHGCKFLLGKKASETHMNEAGAIDFVLLDDGTKIDCDLVIVAAGVRPAVECALDTPIHVDRFIQVSDTMETNCPNIYAAGDVTGLSGIWPNAQKQGKIAAQNMVLGNKYQYEDRFAAKNTINFFGLVSLCVGKLNPEEGDEVIAREAADQYQRAIFTDNKLVGFLQQGDISHDGIYQYLIKNQIDLSDKKDRIFSLSFGDFYGVKENGEYIWR